MLVDAKKAIEACAKVCEDYAAQMWKSYKTGYSADRGNMFAAGKSDGADECAAAIRNIDLSDCVPEETDRRDRIEIIADLASERKKNFDLSAQVAELAKEVKRWECLYDHDIADASEYPPGRVQGTHWEGCEQAHHRCALAKIESLSAQVVELSEQKKKFDRLERMAACGTVDSWMQLSDEDKRAWFAIAVRDSSARKSAEKLAEVRQERVEVLEAQVAELKEQLETLLLINVNWWRDESHCRGEMRELGVPDDADATRVSIGDLRKLLATVAAKEEKK